jgi:hypothetical protein
MVRVCQGLVSMVQDVIMQDYNMYVMVHNGYINMKVRKGIWLAPSGTPRQPPTRQAPSQAWLQSSPAHTWFMDAQVAPNQVSTGGR